MGAYQPRWYLEEAVDAIFDYFDANGGTAEDGSPVRANPLTALPTGTGKSHGISQFSGRAITRYPNTRIVMATHEKNLISQNYERFIEDWPGITAGVYSSGLKRRELDAQVIFCGIQSVRKIGEEFPYIDLLNVDEAHLISPNTDASYGRFITDLQRKNPYLKTVGWTATPYRMGLGLMTNGPMFTDIAYNLTTMEAFNRLIAEGYLCPPIAKKTVAQIDISKLNISTTGDYTAASMEEAVDEITFEALKEVVQYGWDRRSWMVFADGVKNAEKIAHTLRTFFGVPTVAVHSKMPADEADKAIAGFKAGAYRCIVNVDKLTTGFDHPPIDLIAMLRPTMSTGLWVQMLGRGTRPFPGKLNCLVLDFAGNTKRLGPINDPVIPKPRGSGPPGDSPVRICTNCGVYNHSSAKHCVACGQEFQAGYTTNPLDSTASNEDLLRSDLPQVEYFDVLRVVYEVYRSFRNGGTSLKVAYYCNNLRTFYEYIKFEDAKPFAIHKGHEWLRQRTPYADWAIDQIKQGLHTGNAHEFINLGSNEFRIPRRISVWVNQATPSIISHEF